MPSSNSSSAQTKKVSQKALQVLASACIALVFVASGLAVCCLPQSTEALSENFSGLDNPDTPFSHDDLVAAALETRNYTVGNHDREALISMLLSINATSNTEYASADASEILLAPDIYTLDAESISHLDDVYEVLTLVFKVFFTLGIAGVALCIYLGKTQGRNTLGAILKNAGIGVLAFFSLTACWALLDFSGFFTFLHSLFFAAGTWTFSYQSLLITMYPSAFWMGMGIIWLSTTCILSILAITIGLILLKHPHTPHQ